MSATAAAIDADLFRRVMGSFPAGVAVVTTLDAAGRPAGLTTTAVTSVSLSPPLLLVCVEWTSRTLPALRQSGRFAVNLIQARRAEVARHFASKHEQKFAELAWRPAPDGSPILHEHCTAWAESRTQREIEAGDHLILIGEVTSGEVVEGEEGSLVYARRRFGHWAPLDP